MEETALALLMVDFGQGDCLRAAPSGEGVHLGDHGIGLLGLFGRAEVLATRPDRAGRADDGLGRHGGGVGSQGDDRAGGGGHGAARGHVDHHRDGAGADGLGHGGHRKDVTAGGIELQDDQLHLLLLGGLDAAREIVLGGLGDGPIDGQDQCHRPGGGGVDGLQQEKARKRNVSRMRVFFIGKTPSCKVL